MDIDLLIYLPVSCVNYKDKAKMQVEPISISLSMTSLSHLKLKCFGGKSRLTTDQTGLEADMTQETCLHCILQLVFKQAQFLQLISSQK